MTFRLGLGAVLAAIATLTLGAGHVQAAKVVNGGFERGNLSGWEQDYLPDADSPFGVWQVFDEPFFGSTARAVPRGPEPHVPAPPEGEFGAVTDQGDPSVQILSQVVKLKAGKRHRLSFQLAYVNENTGPAPRGDTEGFVTPNTLSLAVDNQQFRMDVLRPAAPIDSTVGAHVLDRVYRTAASAPAVRDWRRVSENLTRFAGGKVRLRFAVAVTEAPLLAAIDAVKVKSKPAG